MQLSRQAAADEVIRRRAIRASLARWAEHCGFKPARHHRMLIEYLEKVARGEIMRLAVFMPPGSAKALALDTPIPTPTGWRTMGSLRVGDQVFADDGKPCWVTWVSPIWKDRPVYRVITDCGDEIIADRDHEWLVRMCGKHDVFKLHTTERLARKRAKRAMIRRAAPLELPTAHLPIDPYVLGVWLGDGTGALPQLTIGADDAQQLVAILIDCGVDLRKNSAQCRYHMHGMRNRFVTLGLLNDPKHKTFGKKYIPAIYMRASIEQRLALLQGLIDTDGTVARAQPGYVTFTNTNKDLAEQVRELVRSLGVKAGWSESRAVLNGKDCGSYYKVSFYHERAARLPRKANLCRNQQRTPNTYVEAIAAGTADTICIEVNSPSHLFLAGRSMTPTHNSTYASILFPSWVLSQDPKAQFLAASHTTELAERWGRRVRNLVTENTSILNVHLSEEQAVGRWGLAEGGEYMAAGANVGIAGFRAKYGLIDDPIRSRQDADSMLVRDRIWDWYLNDFRPRLIPHARQVLIQCLSGDAMISMADGSLKRIDAIAPGERVISWDGTRIVHSKVTATVDNGRDQTYLIRTSGTDVRANARHPFLVLSDGGLRWVRTRDLRRGMRIVTQSTAPMRALPVQSTIAQRPPNAEECAPVITARQNGPPDHDRLRAMRRIDWHSVANGATELMMQILSACLPTRAGFAPYAEPTAALAGHSIGSPTSFPTTIIRRENCAASYATIVTGSRDELEIPSFWNAPSNTSEPVIDVTPYGKEHVYNLTVDGTYNYNANGYWTHNTRWHPDDLAGRCLNHQHWEVLSLPAFAKSDDQLGRDLDGPLWDDDDYGYGEQLKMLRDTTPPRIWSALYQQEPTPDSGDYFKEDWLHPVDILPSLSTMRTYGASDYAVTGDGGDYTVHVVFGVDHLNNLYLLDVWRGKKASDVWIEALCDLVQKYRPLAWAEEGGQIKASLGPYIERRLRERRVYVNRESFPTRGDKSIRARSIQGRMALDGLYYPKRAPWVADWLAELLDFPVSKNDDICDAMGLAGQLLDQMVKGRAGQVAAFVKPLDGYKSVRDRIKTVDAMTL